MSRRRNLPDPNGFEAIAGVNSDVQRVSMRELGGPFDALARSLERWLRAARTAYDAADFESVQFNLRNVRAVYAELSLSANNIDFGPWTS